MQPEKRRRGYQTGELARAVELISNLSIAVTSVTVMHVAGVDRRHADNAIHLARIRGLLRPTADRGVYLPKRAA